jgi:uncharacterized membrane protein YdjX (TVP38/TMEM64 family)
MTEPQARSANALRQWIPAIALAVLIAVAYGFGLHKHLSLEALADNRDLLRQFVDANLALALALYILAYTAIVALSLPGAAVMSITGGFLFGWILGVPASMTAALVGATIVFQIVKTSLGAALAERAGPTVQKLSKGFAENAFSFLLFLRLAPVFPFFIVNAVAGLCRVPLRTFVLATAIGIVPGSLAFALLGSGLDSVIDTAKIDHAACLASGAAGCQFHLSLGDLVTPQLLIAFAGLGAVALIPIALKYLKRQPA